MPNSRSILLSWRTYNWKVSSRLSYISGVCPNNWIHMQGSCYKFFSKGLNWNAAKTACEALGSKLVVINSQAENLAVGDKTGGQGTLIGLHRNPKDKSRWLGLDGSRPTYTPWASGEPNNYGGNEDCAHMRSKSSGYKWNDVACHLYSLPHVCETSGKKSKSYFLVINYQKPGNGWNLTPSYSSEIKLRNIQFMMYNSSNFKRNSN